VGAWVRRAWVRRAWVRGCVVRGCVGAWVFERGSYLLSHSVLVGTMCVRVRVGSADGVIKVARVLPRCWVLGYCGC
jgi:hypothetical protein